MTEHRPECYERFAIARTCVVCDALRACEARILREAQLRVAAMRDLWPTSAPGTIKRSDALAAIKSGGWQSNG